MAGAVLDEPWLRARERVPVSVFQDSDDISQEVAREIAGLIRQRAEQGRRCVLGLATGSTPMHVYRELVRLHQEEGLSFGNVTTFNLDEYYPMSPEALQAVFRALDIVKHRAWFQECGTEVLLYRGAWQEWEPWEADMVVPLSPSELARKIDAIYKHQSQKDRALFPGADAREFWQRAQDRNRATAQVYDRLGLPEYEAMEAFVRYDPDAPSHLFKTPRPAHDDPAHLALKTAEARGGT